MKKDNKKEKIKQPEVIIADPRGPICLPNSPAMRKPMNGKKTNKIYSLCYLISIMNS